VSLSPNVLPLRYLVLVQLTPDQLVDPGELSAFQVGRKAAFFMFKQSKRSNTV
jgi:hypothetical protein